MQIASNSPYRITFDDETVTKSSVGLSRPESMRLLRSCHAQKEAYQRSLDLNLGVEIPEVLEAGWKHGFYSFTMRRIKDAVPVFALPQSEQPKVMDKLLRWSLTHERMNERKTLDRDLLLSKVDSVLENINRVDSTIWAQVVRAADTLLNFFEHRVRIPVGYGHGDLTLCNVLCRGDQVFLFDFLDSFIQSPVLDYAKLRQDTEYGWISLFCPVDTKQRKVLDQMVLDQIQMQFGSVYPDGLKVVEAFTALALLRALPYSVKDWRKKQFLLGALAEAADKIAR